MARDIKAIRQRVDDIYEHLRSDQIGAVGNAVEQVEDLVARLRVHGKDGIKEGELAVIKDRLGEARHKCLAHLKDSVQKLESAKQYGSRRKAQKSVSQGAVEEAMLYLDLLGTLYVASVQFGLAQVAIDYHEGKPDVARTVAGQITDSTAKFRAEFEDVCGRLSQLDEIVRARFGTVLQRRLWLAPVSVGASKIVHAVVEKSAGTKGITVRLPGAAIPIPVQAVAAIGGALLPPVVGGVDAVAQARAEKHLDERLSHLMEASRRTSEPMNQAARGLEVLRTLTEDLASSDE
ncbi:hypothetical protein ABZ920_01795 [Streptomyces sp. NPDC046831]|uniref:hypothetical protein n=1 Tax=Streptomyces sp. NPDC046831 TaxID=3154805 RepID=UPI0034057487